MEQLCYLFHVPCSMISKDEVKHIAKLARLALTEKEVEKFQKEFSSILNYVEELKEVNVSDIAATSHPFEAKNVVRRDEMRLSGASADEAEKLLDLAPEKEKDYLKVKSILR